MFNRVKTADEIKSMRISGQMLATVHAMLKKNAVVGISELEIAELAAKELKSLGGKPTFLGYQGFPSVICISVNNKVVHGIPGKYVLRGGDIASFDFGVTYSGMITDSAFSMVVGKGSKKATRLVETTERSLYAGIDAVRDGCRVGDIAASIEAVLAAKKYGIIRELVGHGVGHRLHEEPDIPNYGIKGAGPKLSAGMTIAIEPMATAGSERIVVDPDGWTIMTADNSLSAHFEHTVLITRDGPEILTVSDGSSLPSVAKK